MNQLDGALTPEGVQAVAAVATLVVAAVAAAIALVQVQQSRDLREEQARPYIVVFAERVGVTTVDLVVKNFGSTAARQVRLSWDRPPLIYWSQAPEQMVLFEELPILAPGQEWRTVWDHLGKRLGAAEPPYSVTVNARDSRLRALKAESFEIATDQFADEMRWDRKDLHEIGVALEKLERTARRWSEGTQGLKVFTRDGATKDDDHAAKREAQRQARNARALHAEDQG